MSHNHFNNNVNGGFYSSSGPGNNGPGNNGPGNNGPGNNGPGNNGAGNNGQQQQQQQSSYQPDHSNNGYYPGNNSSGPGNNNNVNGGFYSSSGPGNNGFYSSSGQSNHFNNAYHPGAGSAAGFGAGFGTTSPGAGSAASSGASSNNNNTGSQQSSYQSNHFNNGYHPGAGSAAGFGTGNTNNGRTNPLTPNTVRLNSKEVYDRTTRECQQEFEDQRKYLAAAPPLPAPEVAELQNSMFQKLASNYKATKEYSKKTKEFGEKNGVDVKSPETWLEKSNTGIDKRFGNLKIDPNAARAGANLFNNNQGATPGPASAGTNFSTNPSSTPGTGTNFQNNSNVPGAAFNFSSTPSNFGPGNNNNGGAPPPFFNANAPAPANFQGATNVSGGGGVNGQCPFVPGQTPASFVPGQTPASAPFQSGPSNISGGPTPAASFVNGGGGAAPGANGGATNFNGNNNNGASFNAQGPANGGAMNGGGGGIPSHIGGVEDMSVVGEEASAMSTDITAPHQQYGPPSYHSSKWFLERIRQMVGAPQDLYTAQKMGLKEAKSILERALAGGFFKNQYMYYPWKMKETAEKNQYFFSNDRRKQYIARMIFLLYGNAYVCRIHHNQVMLANGTEPAFKNGFDLELELGLFVPQPLDK